MPNEAEGSFDKRTNGLESAAQVSPKKSGPYNLTKSEVASIPPLEEVLREKDKVEPSPGNEWTEI